MATLNREGDVFKDRKIAALKNMGSPAIVNVSSGGVTDLLDIAVVRVNGTAADNYQALKSFGDEVYVTLFGQALTQYTIECVTMPEQCEDTKLSTMSALYKKYRIGNDNRPLITITMNEKGGPMTIQGFLVGMPMEAGAAKGSGNIIRFSLIVWGQVVL